MSAYQDFLRSKFQGFSGSGMDPGKVSDRLFPYQTNAVNKLLNIGRGAAFLDTGMGKTAIQIEWARQINRPTIIICPLAVAEQTIAEAAIMDVEITKLGQGGLIEITNYERMHKLNRKYDAVVFDESSIMKSIDSRTRSDAERLFADAKYRLACSATPAPNDYLEIGRQSQVLGIMRCTDMLSRWFINDSQKTGQWRLKGHARSDFWQWVASWAAVASHPSDLGDNETDLSLPPLTEKEAIVSAPYARFSESLFGEMELSATGIRRSKKNSLANRIDKCAEIVNCNEPAIVWCDTNDESRATVEAIEGAIEVTGSMPADEKEARLISFSNGNDRVMVTKPRIAGFGMNWQHCRNVVFAGATYSFEQYYQAVRRCWRFGQKKPVTASVVMTSDERIIWQKVQEKAKRHNVMIEEVRKWASP